MEEKKFIYSKRNKFKLNIYSKKIIEYMSYNFDIYYNVGTKGRTIFLDKEIFYGWVIDYYKNKDVKFMLTKLDKFIIFPIEQFQEYFDIVAKYREKKSGSSVLTQSNISDLELALRNESIQYIMEGTSLISSENLEDRKMQGNKYTYLIKRDNDRYKVRKLSNTRNANVIFSIILKNTMQEKIEQDNLKKFENDIM